jgi:dipeptidyl aminopeptidase/acylaminoacyl peptidase
VRFDLERLETSGEPIQVLDGVYTHYTSQYAVSSNGSLVYAGGPWLDRTRFAWIDLSGTIEVLPLPANRYGMFRLSPEGGRIASLVRGPARHNIWVFDLERGGSSRLTTEGNNSSPVWMPDGESIIFQSDQGGAWKVLRETVGSVPQVDTLWVENLWLEWISPDGRYLGGVRSYSDAPADIVVGDVLEGGPLEPYIAEPGFTEDMTSLSPDGAYAAYTSDASGDFEVYVQPFPATGRQWPVSTDGGEEPIWSSTGDSLYYRIGNRMMGVSVTYEAAGPSFSAPRLIFETEFNNVPGYSYDLSVDDERFLVLLPDAERPDVTHLNVVVNWFEELKRLAPRGNYSGCQETDGKRYVAFMCPHFGVSYCA